MKNIMNVFDVIDTTTDDRTYRNIKRLKLYEIEGRCDRCPPHGGCNKKKVTGTMALPFVLGKTIVKHNINTMKTLKIINHKTGDYTVNVVDRSNSITPYDFDNHAALTKFVKGMKAKGYQVLNDLF